MQGIVAMQVVAMQVVKSRMPPTRTHSCLCVCSNWNHGDGRSKLVGLGNHRTVDAGPCGDESSSC